MTKLGNIELDELSATLKQRGLDGWLIYDFHDSNPIARRLLGSAGMLTRRVFIWLPAVGPPQAIVSGIDRSAMADFGGEIESYTTWQELHQLLTDVIGGRRVAMEISPQNAVPYLDLVPAGLTELLERLGVTLTPSAPLVSQFASRWTGAEVEDHRESAEHIAAIARETLTRAIGQIGNVGEVELQRGVLEAMERVGLETDEAPIVAFGAHSADPHYSPTEATDRTLSAGDVVLLDLWGRSSPNSVWADQTWMAYAGGPPPDEVVAVWETVRDARDAVVKRLQQAAAAGGSLTGADLDNVSRGLITERGYGAAFTHRTGHSIDLELHGSGPHLDDFETHDVRELLTGVAFSVEPGVYLSGSFGMRSEINVIVGEAGPEVTPASPQAELMV